MSNVVALRRSPKWADDAAIPGLIDLFSTRRRMRHDAFWLKENAELLQILAALGHMPAPADLAPVAPRATGLMEELRFFPQYYRMFLSLAVDLRALGVDTAPVEQMADFVVRNRLVEGELSDTHRGEALLLLRRAGRSDARDAGVEARLARFAAGAQGFCLPNRRAAYDLTHIVFHAADYGRAALAPDPARRLGLIHVGMVAWLEENLDLLAEVTIALRLSGERVPQPWTDAVTDAASRVRFETGGGSASLDDDYHQYLVLNWAAGLAGGVAFATPVPAGARIVRQPAPRAAALHELSLVLLDMGEERRPDWSRMRWRVLPRLSEASRARLAVLENMPEFEGFFAGFARCDAVAGGK